MQLVFATNNANKIKEVQALIPNPIKLLSLADIFCIEDISESFHVCTEGGFHTIESVEFYEIVGEKITHDLDFRFNMNGHS